VDQRGLAAALISSRHSAQVAGLPVTPAIDNLTSATSAAAPPALEDMIASTGRALLLTCLWYIREVDRRPCCSRGLPGTASTWWKTARSSRGQQLQVQRVTGRMLGRLLEVGATVPTLPREWATTSTAPRCRRYGSRLQHVSVSRPADAAASPGRGSRRLAGRHTVEG